MCTAASFHIMVTDINHHVRNFLQRELEKEGYAVHSVKSGMMVSALTSGATTLHLIILDPEIFPCFDQSTIEDIVSRNSSVQIIVHTYADFTTDITAGRNIHFVAKDGQSIGALKSFIRTCFELFQQKKTS